MGLSLPQQTPAAIGPVLVSTLHIGNAQLGLLTSASWGGMLLGMIPFGFLVDRYGERRVLAGGAVLLAAALVAASMAPGYWALFALLIPAAVGASSGSPGGARAIAAWFSRSERGTALGIRQGGVTLAGVAAALGLPPIALHLGWRPAFWAVAGAGLVAVAVFLAVYREPELSREATAGSLDLGQLFRNRRFLAATAFAWVFQGVLGATVTYVPVTLHLGAGLSVVAAAGLLALLQVGGLTGRIGWGLLSDRAGHTSTMAITGLLCAAACLLMAWLGRTGTPVVVLACLAFLLGLSALGWNALYIAITAESVPLHHAASAIGIGTAITFTGMFVGAPLYGLLADHSGGYTDSWAALAAWAVLGSLALLVGRPRGAGPRIAAAP